MNQFYDVFFSIIINNLKINNLLKERKESKREKEREIEREREREVKHEHASNQKR